MLAVYKYTAIRVMSVENNKDRNNIACIVLFSVVQVTNSARSIYTKYTRVPTLCTRCLGPFEFHRSRQASRFFNFIFPNSVTPTGEKYLCQIIRRRCHHRLSPLFFDTCTRSAFASHRSSDPTFTFYPVSSCLFVWYRLFEPLFRGIVYDWNDVPAWTHENRRSPSNTDRARQPHFAVEGSLNLIGLVGPSE